MLKNRKGVSPILASLIVFGVLLVIIIVVGISVLFWVIGTKNALVTLDEGTKGAWGNVQTAYQRRADLIPNLVATVRQYSDYEGDLLEKVTLARASVGKANTPADLQKAGEELDISNPQSALSRLLVVVENYPDLKANQNYLDLQAQLEGTENRIKVERDNYNKAIQAYNTRVRMFPTSIVANMYGFGQKDYFGASPGSENAPDVNKLFDQ